MTVVADRYELQGTLGEGGMASVHVALDRVLDRRVAIKLLREDIGRDPVLRERFLREARLSANLAHANIVRVYDAGVEDRTPWMAMELVDGPALREEMSESGPMPADRVVELMGQVLAGLGAAHRAGVIHRDVKPANVLLAPDGAKLGDFGIAKSLAAAGADLTQANQFMGTPKYIAPEVAIGQPASIRSDLYSAAVLTWEMLAGQPPFDHANPLTLAMMHRTDPVPALGPLRPDLPPTLVAAVEQGLAKDPEGRPADADAFAALLAAGLAGRGPSAATAQTQVLSRPSIPPAAAAGHTLALPRPGAPAPGPPAPRPGGPSRPPGRPGPRRPERGGWGVALVVAALIVAAVVAFALSGEEGGGPTPSPSALPSTTAPAPTTTAPQAPSPVAPEPAPQPAPVEPPPVVPADPTTAPATTTPPATATAAPEPPPEPTAEPPPEPAPLIDLFTDGGG